MDAPEVSILTFNLHHDCSRMRPKASVGSRKVQPHCRNIGHCPGQSLLEKVQLESCSPGSPMCGGEKYVYVATLNVIHLHVQGQGYRL